MIRIAICDDEAPERQKLHSWLNSYYSTQGMGCVIREYDCGEALLADYEEHSAAYDLVFLDICMDGIDGVETATAVRRFDQAVPIVFLTTSPDHAIAGYTVGADGYLLKPANNAALTALMERLEVQFRIRAENTLLIGGPTHSMRLPVADICYLESGEKGVDIHMADGTSRTFAERFGELEPRLTATCFLKCNRGLIINMDHVMDAGDDFTMRCGARIPIKVRERKRIREAYYAYMMLTHTKLRERVTL